MIVPSSTSMSSTSVTTTYTGLPIEESTSDTITTLRSSPNTSQAARALTNSTATETIHGISTLHACLRMEI